MVDGCDDYVFEPIGVGADLWDIKFAYRKNIHKALWRELHCLST